MIRNHRRKLAGPFIALAVLAALLLLGRSGRRLVAAPLAASAPPEPVATGEVAAAAPRLPAAARSPAVAHPEPRLEALEVERREVCAGEESLVTVRAHAADGDDAHLRVFIDGQEGDRVPVRARLDAHGGSRPIVARLVAHDGLEREIPVPIVARDCEAEPRVAVATTALANTWDQYELVATVYGKGTLGKTPFPKIPPAEVRSFAWDFGDGSPGVTTREPRVEHSYEGRSEDRSTSSFLVRVEATLKDGRRIAGRSSVALVNRAKRTLDERGIVLIMTSSTPDSPVAADDGSVTQTVHLWHERRDDVRILGVARYATDAQGKRLSPEGIDVASFFGADSIPARRGADVRVTLPPGTETYVTYEIVGRTSDGLEARGRFSILRPPPPPTKETATPIADPKLVADVRSARAILGKPFVTDEDLTRLRADGRI